MNAYKLFIPICIANFFLIATDILMAGFLVKYLTQTPIETPKDKDQVSTEVEATRNETVPSAQVELSANQIKEKTDKQRLLDRLYLEHCYGLPPYLKMKVIDLNDLFNPHSDPFNWDSNPDDDFNWDTDSDEDHDDFS